jgi:hypothetical protein
MILGWQGIATFIGVVIVASVIIYVAAKWLENK